MNLVSKGDRRSATAPVILPRPGVTLVDGAIGRGPLPKILLVVPDEHEGALVLADGLRAHGYDISSAPDASPGERHDFDRRPHLVLYRLTSPVGWTELAARNILDAEAPALPGVVCLVDEASEEDRIAALDSGADDVVVLPVSIRELASRLRAVIRRRHPAAYRELLTFKDIALDRAGRRATRAGMPMALTKKEVQLLQVLMEHPRRVMSRQRLIDEVWGPRRYVEIRTVDAHIRRLRVGLGDQRFELIRTIRNVGYMLGSEEPHG